MNASSRVGTGAVIRVAGAAGASTRPDSSAKDGRSARLVQEMGRDENCHALIARQIDERSQNWSRANGSTPEVGSSRMQYSGSWTIADSERQSVADAERQILARCGRGRGDESANGSPTRAFASRAEDETGACRSRFRRSVSLV